MLILSCENTLSSNSATFRLRSIFDVESGCFLPLRIGGVLTGMPSAPEGGPANPGGNYSTDLATPYRYLLLPLEPSLEPYLPSTAETPELSNRFAI